MRLQRQKLPFTCNQRRGTLLFRITWKGDWTSGVSLRYESTSRGQKFSKSKKFSSFSSNRVFPMFQDSGIILSEKIFSQFQTTLSPGIAMRSQRQKLPLTCHQRRRTLPVRITWKGDWTSGVSLRCESTSRGQKFSKSKNFQLFSNRVFPMFQDSGIILSEKIFSDFQTTLSPGIAMRSQRQKLLLTCNQRRRTLPVRIIWKGVSLHCDARVPDASRGQKFSKSKKFSNFFKTGFLHVSGLWDNFKRKKFFRLSDQSESRYCNEIPKAETPLHLYSEKADSPCSDHRITLKGDWTSVVSLRCESASRGQKFSKSKNFSKFRFYWISGQFLGTAYWGKTSWGNISGTESRGAGGQWGSTSWGITSLGQYPWGRTSLGQNLTETSL